MVQAISSSVSAPGGASGGPSAASLQAQLQRFQQQLSDCVNCASAKTPEGKTAIREAAAKVSQVTQQLDALQNAGHRQAGAATDGTAPVGGAHRGARDGLGANIDVEA